MRLKLKNPMLVVTDYEICKCLYEISFHMWHSLNDPAKSEQRIVTVLAR